MDANNTVAASVRSIISAFTSGLDVFTRLRDRRSHGKIKRRQHRKNSKHHGSAAKEDEIHILSQSFQRGSESISREFDARYRAVGQDFATGDGAAQSSLAAVLLKLNTGIAHVISAFIRHGQKNQSEPFEFDARSLIELSNRSQAETLHTLEQLHSRLIRRPPAIKPSPVHRDPIAGQILEGRPRRHQHRNNVSSRSPPDAHREQGDREEKKSRKPKRHAEVARVPIKPSSSHTQLVVIRPRNRRTSSSSSTQSATSPLTPPARIERDTTYFPLPLSHLTRPPRPSQRIPNPRTPPTGLPTTPYTSPPPRPPKIPIHPHPSMTSRPLSTLTHHTTLSTPSTLIGEIPMTRWLEPWDYAEAERLNALALSGQEGETAGSAPQGQQGGKKFWGFWRKERRNDS